MSYYISPKTYSEAIDRLSSAASKMGGLGEAFKDGASANKANLDRYEDLAQEIYFWVAEISNNLTPGNEGGYTCLSRSAESQLDRIIDIANWIEGDPLSLLSGIQQNAFPLTKITGINIPDKIIDFAADLPPNKLLGNRTALGRLDAFLDRLPAMWTRWAAQKGKLERLIADIDRQAKNCDGDDEDDDDDDNQPQGEDCERIASAIEKLADCFGDGDGDGDDEENEDNNERPRTNNERLDDIEKLLEKICKVVGCDEFPVEVPKNVTDENAGLIPKQNIPELITWHFLQMDSLIGKFPIKIKIKDADLDAEGDEEKEICLPNLAEAVAELFGQASSSAIISGTILNTSMRSLIEAGMNRKTSIQNYFWTEAIADYLGFDVEEHFEKIPFSFDLTEVSDLEKALNSTHVEIPCVEFKPNRKQSNDWQFGLKELLSGVAILRAAFGNPLDPNSPNQVKEDLLKLDTRSDDGGDFDAFINTTEAGYTNKPGIKDSNNPYGRPYDQRPWIREIGVDGDAREDL